MRAATLQHSVSYEAEDQRDYHGRVSDPTPSTQKYQHVFMSEQNTILTSGRK